MIFAISTIEAADIVRSGEVWFEGRKTRTFDFLSARNFFLERGRGQFDLMASNFGAPPPCLQQIIVGKRGDWRSYKMAFVAKILLCLQF